MTNTITLNNKTYNVNELTTEHFNTRYYDEEKGFDYTIKEETFRIVNRVKKDGTIGKDEKINNITYFGILAVGKEELIVKDTWTEIVKVYIYD
jgi:hypothetical protein